MLSVCVYIYIYIYIYIHIRTCVYTYIIRYDIMLYDLYYIIGLQPHDQHRGGAHAGRLVPGPARPPLPPLGLQRPGPVLQHLPHQLGPVLGGGAEVHPLRHAEGQ